MLYKQEQTNQANQQVELPSTCVPLPSLTRVCHNRSAASPGVKARNAPPPVPLQTLQEAPEPSDASPTTENGGAIIPRVRQRSDSEGAKADEMTPLNVEESTSPSEPHENHCVK